MSLIKVENLAAGYGLVEVLRDISLEIKEGEVVAVLGLSLIHISEPTRPY